MGSTAVSASPQQREKFDSYFQKVKWYSWFIASLGEDGVLPCPSLVILVSALTPDKIDLEEVEFVCFIGLWVSLCIS